MSEGGADLVLQDGDLAIEEGLLTAGLVSLFSDARAPSDVSLPVAESRRGFWGEEVEDPFGSLLWLLDREKVTAATIERYRTYAARSLQWLIDEGIAQRVEVTAARGAQDRVEVVVQLHRGEARRWARLWAGTAQDPVLLAGLKVRILTL